MYLCYCIVIFESIAKHGYSASTIYIINKIAKVFEENGQNIKNSFRLFGLLDHIVIDIFHICHIPK